MIGVKIYNLNFSGAWKKNNFIRFKKVHKQCILYNLYVGLRQLRIGRRWLFRTHLV